MCGRGLGQGFGGDAGTPMDGVIAPARVTKRELCRKPAVPARGAGSGVRNGTPVMTRRSDTGFVPDHHWHQSCAQSRAPASACVSLR